MICLNVACTSPMGMWRKHSGYEGIARLLVRYCWFFCSSTVTGLLMVFEPLNHPALSHGMRQQLTLCSMG